MGDDGTTYGFDLHAGSPSLARAMAVALCPLRPCRRGFDGGRTATACPSSEPLVGHTEVNVSQLDFEVVTSLLPLHAAWQPHGHIQQGPRPPGV